MNEYRRKITFFEKVLLLVGVVIGLLGFYLINNMYVAGGKIMSFDMLSVVFLWIILLFLVVVTAVSENQREESGLISKELHEETKLMKELIKDQVLEMKLLRQDLIEIQKLSKAVRKSTKAAKK